MLHRAEIPEQFDIDSVYARHVNDQWVRLINLLGLNKRYVHCAGVELRTDDGETYLDFLSGYGVYNAGHNHPTIRARLIDELEGFGPTMLQSHLPELAARLARRHGRGYAVAYQFLER